MKRITKICICLLALVVFYSVTVFASEDDNTGFCSGDSGSYAVYTYDVGTLIITGKGTIDGLKIPDTIKEEMKTLSIGEGITKIHHSSFWNSKKLTKVVLPNSLREIEDSAFERASFLREINLPDKLTRIGKDAFRYCSSITSLTLPKGLKSIGISAFEGCSNISNKLVIPDSVEEIGGYAFFNCRSIPSVKLPARMLVIPEGLFYGCRNLSEITWPDHVLGIESMAFNYCNLTSIDIPSDVMDIGHFAFEDNKTSSIKLPSSVLKIGEDAFRSSAGTLDVYYDGYESQFNKIKLCVLGDNTTSSLSIYEILYYVYRGEQYASHYNLEEDCVTINNNRGATIARSFSIEGGYFDENVTIHFGKEVKTPASAPASSQAANEAPAQTQKQQSQPSQGPALKTVQDPQSQPSQGPASKAVQDPITIDKVASSVKAKAKKNKVTVSWKKIKKNKSGKELLKKIKSIQVQYSTDPQFKQNLGTKTIGKKKTKVKLKLERKTQYYVRVRYVGVDGVSAWSMVKMVKTK